jgi:hypothetical protein
MSIIRDDAEIQTLVITKGHPFDRDGFFGMLEGLPGIATTQVEQPAAQVFFTPEMARPWDAYVLYDMPGIEFGPDGLRFHDPPKDYVEGFLALLEAGHGFVFLHHAIDTAFDPSSSIPCWRDSSTASRSRTSCTCSARSRTI